MSRLQPFVHLHTHSHYSLLQALPKIPELVAAAKADGQSALALTDAGNLYGAIDFYKECKKQGVKPVIGADLYIAPRTRHDKEHITDNHTSRLVLLAKNETGYRNLIKLVSRSFMEGFYYHPRADRELLAEYADGIIAVLPSFAGEHVRALKEGARERAQESIGWHREVFGSNLYLELTHHPEAAGHMERMADISALAREANVPLVAAHDTYYIKTEDALARELVNKIRTGERLDREYGIGTDDFSFISQKQAAQYFKDIPEALANTTTIADSCTLELELGAWVFPNFKIPAGTTHDAELRSLAHKGLAMRAMKETPDVKERLDYELSVIAKKGYSKYFLVVADLLNHARENNILTNTRGSAAGSLVSYLCGITTVDPLEYQLPFERFLNPDRPSPPDIDMDLADNRRDELIDYVRNKYGEDHVAQIGTFGTMLARAAVRDVARALGYAYGTADQIAKVIPFGKQGFPVTIENALRDVPELQEMYATSADARDILDLARKIEGNARHVGVHAAGVVISPTPVTDFVPIQPDPKGGKVITQFDMHAVEDAGLLKFDFLGLKNLSVLADSVSRVQKRLSVNIDTETLPLNDTKTYEMLSRGETLGVFQFAGSGMTSHLVDLKPTEIHDLNAMVALYRPGPMAFIPDYIERKRNPSLVQYLDPRMESILKRSYGIITYQDDVLMIAIDLAGYSWIEADKFRKAIGKKIPAEMAAQKDRFFSGCIEHGMRPEIVQRLWDQIETFAAYGFNKCLTADIRVINADTGVPERIGDLYARGKPVCVHALGENHKLRSARATTPFENGTKRVFKMRTRSGREIRATDNHPFLTWSGWMPLGSLGRGARVAVPRRIPDPVRQKPMPHHESAVLGYLIAEGNLCHPNGVYFYTKEEDELRDFARAAQQFPNTRITIDRSKPAASIYIGQKNQREGNSVRAWLGSLGILGLRATEKHIPPRVFSADRKSLAVFLGKLWQGDGTASTTNCQLFYATSSRQLAEDVQHLLLRFGIINTIHTNQFRYRGALKPGWTVVVTGEENLGIFSRTIGAHLIGKKKALVRTVAHNASIRTNNRGRGTSDTIPVPVLNLIRSEMAATGLTARTLAQKTGIAERLFYTESHKRGYTRSTLARVAQALHSAQLAMYAKSDIFWDEIISIEADGEEMTYDLSVPGLANFVANDIVVHNSHAASYGNLAYKTAYMKANFPIDYMAALLTADSGDVEKIAAIVAECKHMGIQVLPPDVNESFLDFTVVEKTGSEGKAIRFGLGSIKNFGQGIALSIIEEREAHGPYKHVADLLARVRDKNLNHKSLESLIRCGALDPLRERGHLVAHLDLLLSYHKEHMQAPENQDSLFGSAAKEEPGDLSLPDAGPISPQQRLAWEKELLGLYVSGHPLDAYRDILSRQKLTIASTKTNVANGMTTVIAGLLENIQSILTKNGERMVFARLSDLSDSVEIVAFPRVLKEYGSLLQPEKCVMIKGRMSLRNGEKSFVAEAVKSL